MKMKKYVRINEDVQTATKPPPWVSRWPDVVLYSSNMDALEYYRAAARERARQRSRLTIYAYGHDDNVLRVAAGHEDRQLTGWERFPVENPYDHYPLNQLAGEFSRRLKEEAAAHPYSPSFRTWLVCSVLVVLLLMVARFIERVLRHSLALSRQRAQEGPTPNVWATSQPGADDTVIIPGLEGAEPLPANLGEVTTDLPPPYSECTGPGPSSGANKPTERLLFEDSPPAYPYIGFTNKNGIPSVLIFSRRQIPLANRRDIAAAETGNNDETTAEQNTENTNTEMTNGAERELESIETTNIIDASSNNETVNTDMNGSNAVNPATSTCETTVDIDEDENTLKGGVVIV